MKKLKRILIQEIGRAVLREPKELDKFGSQKVFLSLAKINSAVIAKQVDIQNELNDLQNKQYLEIIKEDNYSANKGWHLATTLELAYKMFQEELSGLENREVKSVFNYISKRLEKLKLNKQRQIQIKKNEVLFEKGRIRIVCPECGRYIGEIRSFEELLQYSEQEKPIYSDNKKHQAYIKYEDGKICFYSRKVTLKDAIQNFKTT